MATTTVAAQKLDLNGATGAITFSTGTTNDLLLDFTGADNKTVILLKGAGTLTLKAGNGIQGVADLALTSDATLAAFRVDSGLFKIVSGENKGYILATPSANTVTAAVVQLP